MKTRLERRGKARSGWPWVPGDETTAEPEDHLLRGPF